MKKTYVALFVLVILVGSSVCASATTLNFLEVMTNPERTALLKSMIAEYEAMHPDIKINLISPPYEQSDQKATLMLNTMQPLDIIEVRDYTVKQFVNNKKLTDLTEYFADWSDAETLTGVADLAARTVNDTPYLVPQSIFIKALYVRKDILAAHGIDHTPETLEELVEISKKITNPAKNQYGFAWRGKSFEIKFSDLFGSSYVEDFRNAKHIYSEDETFFLDPGYKEGMELYATLFKEGAPKDAINWGFNEQINGFVSGTTPFLIQDPDAIPLIDKLLGPDKYEVVTLPVGPHGFTYIDYGFCGLGIPSYSKNKKEAWDFIQWMSSPEKNGYFNEHYGPLPVHTTTFTMNKHFQGRHYVAFNQEMNDPETFVFITYDLASEKWPGWAKIHETDLQSVLLGRMKLDDALQKWADYWEK
ncbi:MAG: sugar ABC transporter substrate-binding protein [Firmicutes bacterium]|nr:sugar ABC transporter substrate-binding protein [Bacillota bacterium]